MRALRATPDECVRGYMFSSQLWADFCLECRFHSRPGRIPFDRTLLPSQRKSDHDPQRVSRRSYDLHHDGVHRGGESADSVEGWHTCRWSGIRHLHLFGRSHAGDGSLRELSHRARSRNVAECIFHLRRLPADARAVAYRARCHLFLRGGVPLSYRHPRAGADRKRNSGLPETFDCGRDRNVHRVRWIAECESGSCQSCDIRQSGNRLPTAKRNWRAWDWRSC